MPLCTNFSIPLLTVLDVGRCIESLEMKKSMGPDKISPFFLKLALPYIVEPLTHAYNQCIKQNSFPSSLKTAKIIPLPKGSHCKEPGDFRPISILPILAKPLEKHVQKCLLEYMENNNLFHEFQSGFRENHSCSSAINSLVNTWISSINSHNFTGAVFLDFKKAFDLVNHDILLKKMDIYMKNNESLSFFKSYLSNRYQYVSVNCNTSQYGNIHCGVPQGSNIGPLLFCIYINDLPLNLRDKSVQTDLFADDSNLHTKGNSINEIESSLQSALDDAESWAIDNRMILHPLKSKSMVIATRQKHQLTPLKLELSLQSLPIEQVTKHKVLGVVLDQNLSWDDHINQLCKKLSKNVYLLSKLAKVADQKSLLIFANAHIFSHIDYASTLWDGASENSLKPLKSIYRRVAKLILKGDLLSTDQKLRKLNILPLQERCFYNKAILMFKVFHGKTPNYISSMFQKSYSKYRSMNFLIPNARLDICQSSLSFMGASLWNKLPETIKSSKSLTTFKRKLKQFYISST